MLQIPTPRLSKRGRERLSPSEPNNGAANI